MVDRVGAVFPARISGVARFGLFARLDETGADGIIPINSLPDDYYIHDEKRHALVGRRSRRVFSLAMPVQVKLVQADRLTGGMAFAIVEDKEYKSRSGFSGADRAMRDKKRDEKRSAKREKKKSPKQPSRRQRR